MLLLVIRINSNNIVEYPDKQRYNSSMEFKRVLDLAGLLQRKSFFLLGPRSTGKSHLIRRQLEGKAFVINLLRGNWHLRLSADPSRLEDHIVAGIGGHKIVVIDEVQRIPALLSEVHELLESRDWRFLLTGSSARKLKQADVDLLGGRAWNARMFPLTTCEIPDFDLDRYLRFGGLPQVYPSADPEEELNAYIETYLNEEIRMEGLIRRLPPFSRFLKTAALDNGNLLNFAQIASDCEVAASTVREYYAILSDTLVGFMLEPWMFSKKRKAIQTAKFYFFDTGVTHALAGTQSLDRNSSQYGTAFEQFIGMELRAYLSYRRVKQPLTFWRSTHGHEVDFIIGDNTAIEVKSSAKISRKHLAGLTVLAEERVCRNYYLVCHDRVGATTQGIHIMHWEKFLDKLWRDEIVLK